MARIVGEEGANRMIKGTYRHFKGKLYVALGVVMHSESEEEMVLYRPIDSEQLWVRPLSMWTEHIERSGYSGPRFTRISADIPSQPGLGSTSVP
jgi:hypothetical protein